MPKIIVTILEDYPSDLFCLEFRPISDGLTRIAQSLGAYLKPETNQWIIGAGNGTLHQIFSAYKGIAWIDYSSIKEASTSNKHIAPTANIKRKRNEIKEKVDWPENHKNAMWDFANKLKSRRYSENTFRTYGSFFKRFLKEHLSFDPELISEEQIKTYVQTTVEEYNYATKTQNQIINAIKFYYEQVLGLEKKVYWLDRPRRESKLPFVVSEEDIIRLIASTGNLKHKCLISIIYSAGLRRTEVLNLKVSDVDLDRFQIFVRGGKGKKDRTSLLSHILAKALHQYYLAYKPSQWLFEGLKGGQYSATSLSKVVERARQKSGIQKQVTPHILRHSFATHLLDKGVDIRYIQELLGHNSVSTTEIYTHVSKKDLQMIKSPLDRIFEDLDISQKKLT